MSFSSFYSKIIFPSSWVFVSKFWLWGVGAWLPWPVYTFTFFREVVASCREEAPGGPRDTGGLGCSSCAAVGQGKGEGVQGTFCLTFPRATGRFFFLIYKPSGICPFQWKCIAIQPPTELLGFMCWINKIILLKYCTGILQKFKRLLGGLLF